MQIHVVQPGDSLWAVSQKYNVTINQIVTANQLENPNRLIPGLALVIPTPNQTAIVKPGETISMIANRYRTNVQSILQANRISDPTKIYPGMTIVIPPIRHTVLPGETLWHIAQQYGTSVQAIVQINNIQNIGMIYPSTMLQIPPYKPTIDVNAYSDRTGTTAANLFHEVGAYLTYGALFAYSMHADGSLSAIDDAAFIQTAKVDRIAPMLCITNFTYQDPGSKLAHTILSSTAIQTTLLSNVLNTMKQKGFYGLNIDFENVYPQDRELYNQFLQLAVDTLHPAGYFVSTALAPKVSADQKGLLYEAHDYPTHGKIVDFVVLMTYEWGYRFGPPQAISPLDQIRRVLDYAVTVIPRNKIFMGFQIYARDWKLPHIQGQQAETFSQQEAIHRAVQYGAAIQYDQVAQSPHFRYTDSQAVTHEVWFEDARSAQAKFDTAKDYGLRGISYWTLGYPYPQNWLLLNDNFTIRKLL